MLNGCLVCRLIAHGQTGIDDREPVVQPVKDCEALLNAAENFNNGHLVPYLALCLFAGLRPIKLSWLTWEQVSLTDGEIRLIRQSEEHHQKALSGTRHQRGNEAVLERFK
jgi:hypothetical protein